MGRGKNWDKVKDKLANSERRKRVGGKKRGEKIIFQKILVLERSGLHHRIKNIEKFLAYKFRHRLHRSGARPQLSNKKNKIFFQVE